MTRVEPAPPGYLRDESRLQGWADAAIFPTDTAEAVEAIRSAGAITIQGARTGVAGGAAPRGGLILSTERMNRPLNCRLDGAGTPILRVQAGMRFADLTAFLSRSKAPPDWPPERGFWPGGRYRFPPSPTEASATLGGAFAVNARGPNSLRYGGTGAWAADLTWITPLGERWEIERGRYRFDETGCPLPDGSRLDTDAALPCGALALLHPAPGLDLIDFLAGSEGLLGMAAELGLSLQPVPAASWGVVFFFRTPQGAGEFAAALSRWRGPAAGGACLSSAEYYDRQSLELVRAGALRVTALGRLPRIKDEYQSALQVELEGDDPGLLEAALMEQLALFAGCGGGDDDTWAAVDRGETEKYRLLRHGVPELINAEVDRIRQTLPGFCKTAGDFMVSPESALRWERRYHRDMAEAGLRGFVFGHILEGRLHVNLLAEDEAAVRRCGELLESWAAAVVEEGGLLAAENGVGKLRAPLAVKFLSVRRLEQIQGIITRMDPGGVLANGGFRGANRRFDGPPATRCSG